jgi:hypothetical protein
MITQAFKHCSSGVHIFSSFSFFIFSFYLFYFIFLFTYFFPVKIQVRSLKSLSVALLLLQGSCWPSAKQRYADTNFRIRQGDGTSQLLKQSARGGGIRTIPAWQTCGTPFHPTPHSAKHSAENIFFLSNF